jgi:hypothetical protein
MIIILSIFVSEININHYQSATYDELTGILGFGLFLYCSF